MEDAIHGRDHDDIHVPGVLAMEFAPGTQALRDALSQDEAAGLGELLGRDLAMLIPEAASLDLLLGAAHFDPAEALRAGWPLHRRLRELGAAAPGRRDAPRIIVFGADAQGEVPLPLRADPALRGGHLRVLPFVLRGDAAIEGLVRARMEAVLFDQGMAQPATALRLQETFAARIEHARHLTLHDLAAMTAMQYRHLGLEGIWHVIETALLAPDEEAWLDAPPEPLVHYVAGEARIALFDPPAWRARYQDGAGEADALDRLFHYFEARQRQLAAVLEAHGIPVVYTHCSGGSTRDL
jgi:hypothetical protein